MKNAFLFNIVLHYLDTETLIGLNAGLHRHPRALCLLLNRVCSQPSGCWVLPSTSHWTEVPCPLWRRGLNLPFPQAHHSHSWWTANQQRISMLASGHSWYLDREWMRASPPSSHRLIVLRCCQLLPCLNPSHACTEASARAGGWAGAGARHLRTSSFPSFPTPNPTPHAFSLVPWISLVKHKFKVKIKTVKPTPSAEQ